MTNYHHNRHTPPKSKLSLLIQDIGSEVLPSPGGGPQAPRTAADRNEENATPHALNTDEEGLTSGRGFSWLRNVVVMGDWLHHLTSHVEPSSISVHSPHYTHTQYLWVFHVHAVKVEKYEGSTRTGAPPVYYTTLLFIIVVCGKMQNKR